MPKTQWPEDEDGLRTVMSKWSAEVGDCRQELVFIGLGMEQEAMIHDLNTCLLTTEEMRQGDPVWESWADPFPRWMEANPADGQAT